MSSSCAHNNTGQELCYVCYQRSKRNVYVDFAEERRRREEEENKLLREYNEHRSAVEMNSEQVRVQMM